MLYIFLLTCTIIFVVWYTYAKLSKSEKLISLIPGKEGWFLLGNALDFLGPRDELIQRFANYVQDYREEGLAKAWAGKHPVVLLFKAKTIEPVVTSSSNIDKAIFYKFIIPWLGFGLLTSSGKKWHQRRKLLTPAFHFRILDDFVPIINEQSETLVKNLERFAGKGECELFKCITLCTLDIICATAMGRNMNAQTYPDSDYVKAVVNVSELVVLRAFTPWLELDFVYNLTSDGRKTKSELKILHEFTKKVIEDRRQELNSQNVNGKKEENSEENVYGKKRRVAFLDLLLEISENGKVLTDQDIQEEVDTFMFEGHDTTSSGIFWTLYLLGLNEDIQRKLQDELDSVFGDDGDIVVTTEHLAQLKYLECVCKESMRICTPVPFIGRRLTTDVQIGKYTVPAGTNINIMIYQLHRDEEYFPNPEKFDPDRFLPENCAGRHPYAYLPFSAGPRNCIGQKFAMMEEKIVLIHVLRKFSVNTLYKKGDIRGPAELVLKPSVDIKMQIFHRTH